uniref:Uncharacterized protein n=1 Tax=viral metagenome TaxID=1070528 RepID=A0A6M3LKQ0_9ZZZZ
MGVPKALPRRHGTPAERRAEQLLEASGVNWWLEKPLLMGYASSRVEVMREWTVADVFKANRAIDAWTAAERMIEKER